MEVGEEEDQEGAAVDQVVVVVQVVQVVRDYRVGLVLTLAEATMPAL